MTDPATVPMHVRCPVNGCNTTVLVDQQESWGDIDPDDYGCITVTVTGDLVGEHMRTHTHEERAAARRGATDA